MFNFIKKVFQRSNSEIPQTTSLEEENIVEQSPIIIERATNGVVGRGQITITDITDIITQATAPNPATEGMLWMDTSLTPPVLKVRRGNAWLVQNDFKNDSEYNVIKETLRTNTSEIAQNKKDISLKVSQSEVNNIVVTEVGKTQEINKWKRYKYNKQLSSSSAFPSFAEINGLTPIYEDVYSDNLNLVTGLTGNYFIAHLKTNVYVSANKTLSLIPSAAVDDTASFFLNGKKVADVNNTEGITFNFVVGWNAIDILFYEHAGGESLSLNKKISDNVDKMSYAIGNINTDTKTENKFTSINNQFAEIKQDLGNVNLTVSEIKSGDYVNNVENDKLIFMAGVGNNQTNKDINKKIKNGLVDLKLKGRTLINIASVVNFSTAGNRQAFDKTTIDNGVKYTKNAMDAMVYPRIDIDSSAKCLEPNTTYTIFIRIKSNDASILRGINISKGGDSYVGYSVNYKNTNDVIGNGVYKTTFTTPSLIADISQTYFKLGFNGWGLSQKDKYVEISEVMVIKGNWINHDIKYFKGIYSPGQDLMELESIGKNLFDKNKASYQVGRIHEGNGTVIGIDSTRHAGDSVSEYIPVIPGETYTFSGQRTGSACPKAFYDINREFILGNVQVNNSIIAPPKAAFLRTSLYESDKDIFQIEKSISKTDYETPKRDSVVFRANISGKIENIVLRAVNNTIYDTIEKHADGKFYWHKRCEVVIFDGSEDYGEYGGSRDETHVCYNTSSKMQKFKKNGDNRIICDRFKNVVTPWAKGSHYGVNHTQNYTNIYFRVSISLANTANDFKNWIRNNNTTIVYQLDVEEIYECVDISISSFNNGTLMLSEKVPPVIYTSHALNMYASIESALSSININKNSIEQKVDVNGVIAAINASVVDGESNVGIQADKIQLKGAVNIENMEDSLAQIFEHGSDKTEIKGGFIKSGSIDLSGHIRAAKGLTITDGHTEGAKETFNVTPDGSVYMAGTVESMNFVEEVKDSNGNVTVPGAGWRVDKYGNAIFNQGEFRAKVLLPQAGMSNEGSIRIWAGGDTPGSARFRVTEDGEVHAERGYFNGTFSGLIEVGGISISDEGKDKGRGSITITDNSSKLITEIADDRTSIGSNFYVKNFLTVESEVKVGATNFNFNDKIKLLNSDSSISFNDNVAKMKLSGTKLDFISSNTSQSSDFEFSNSSRAGGTIVDVKGKIIVDQGIDIGILTIKKTSEGVDFLFI